jgi:hypothetical protein
MVQYNAEVSFGSPQRKLRDFDTVALTKLLAGYAAVHSGCSRMLNRPM